MKKSGLFDFVIFLEECFREFVSEEKRPFLSLFVNGPGKIVLGPSRRELQVYWIDPFL